mmetsp:Transcript_2523/g.3151  ORF Transcript_2523/g.3151 Transcript_2523/m.3151 type:complete len:83 (+) Transcript_2523:1776-2024(+)
MRCRYTCVKIFTNAIDLFSKLFFWYLVTMTGYWFIFFKLQERVYCFLPGLDTHSTNYKPYDFLFGFVAGSKLCIVMYKIYFE